MHTPHYLPNAIHSGKAVSSESRTASYTGNHSPLLMSFYLYLLKSVDIRIHYSI